MRLTSGRVTPHIEFDSWQVLEIDPFYVPETKEVKFLVLKILGNRRAWGRRVDEKPGEVAH